MQTSNYDLINRCMIAPLSVLFSVKLADEIIEGFVEDLAGFDEPTLKASFKELRRECKRMPSLAQVIEVCKKNAPIPITNQTKKGEQFHCLGHSEVVHASSARKILSSPAGRLALSLGVARDLLVEYEISGRAEFDEYYVRKCKSNLDKATQDLVALKADSDIGKAMHIMYESMVAREKRLFSEFSIKLAA